MSQINPNTKQPTKSSSYSGILGVLIVILLIIVSIGVVSQLIGKQQAEVAIQKQQLDLQKQELQLERDRLQYNDQQHAREARLESESRTTNYFMLIGAPLILLAVLALIAVFVDHKFIQHRQQEQLWQMQQYQTQMLGYQQMAYLPREEPVGYLLPARRRVDVVGMQPVEKEKYYG